MALFSRFFSVFILLLLLQPPTVFGSPKLVLLLSLDQLSPGRLNAEMFGGLGRLIREGRVFSNASLNHGVTTTCPGHVVIATCVNPAKAGIAGNRYIDHATGEQRYCVDDTDDANRVYGAENNRSPNAMAVTALGDWLKASSPTSRVYSVSGKDRAAITLGGKNPNGVYWYESEVAKFTSSRYYGPLPDYVESFNGENFF
jgi:predicted AlkP superfamily pyrophosphatase or phosphodiesterase